MSTATRNDYRPDVSAPVWERVIDLWDETDDTFTLETDGGGEKARFVPGQFRMLTAPGVGEVPISISGSDGRRWHHTVRSVGAVTRALRRVTPGDVIGARGPFGTGWPLDRASGGDLVIVAGGIGLAPLRPAVCEALARRDSFDQLVLLYGARTPDDILFDDDLHTWRGRFDLDVDVTVDTAGRRWKGAVGVVTKLVRRARFDPHETTAFVCGPEIMMRYAAAELMSEGVRPDRIHVSVERNMQCGTGWCGHCQLGPYFVCRDGPVMPYDRVSHLLDIPEV